MSKTNEQLKYNVSTHYAFGSNWSEYSRSIEEETIQSATEELLSLAGRLAGRSFLDIGCGSGLHALCALRLGANPVVAIDLDPDSVETTRRVVRERWSKDNFECQIGNVFNLQDSDVRFDVVYSWGVLHHTGAMWTAIEQAARAVACEGHLIIAVYRKTPLCGFWRIEKRIYSRLPRVLQYVFDIGYGLAYCIGNLLVGRNPVRAVRSYRDRRGMNLWHDIRDWLGGYPYESASPHEVESFLKGLGFALELRRKDKVASRIVRSGLLGSGCVEYRFRRTGAAG